MEAAAAVVTTIKSPDGTDGMVMLPQVGLQLIFIAPVGKVKLASENSGVVVVKVPAVHLSAISSNGTSPAPSKGGS